MNVKEKISVLQEKLDATVNEENLTSQDIIILSSQLDNMIVEYYRQNNRMNTADVSKPS